MQAGLGLAFGLGLGLGVEGSPALPLPSPSPSPSPSPFQAARKASNDWASETDVEAARDALVAAIEAKKAEVG